MGQLNLTSIPLSAQFAMLIAPYAGLAKIEIELLKLGDRRS
jgi:hypothetical protein